MYDIILGINLSLFMLVGFYSIILAYKRLVRPGVSIEMRKLFLKKHALYVVALIIIWIFCLLYNYYDLFNPYNALSQLHIRDLEIQAQLSSPPVQIVSYIAMFSTGVVMVSIRIFDPFFRFLVQQTCLEWFGVIKQEPKEGINAEVLSTFLSSSLNIELVYIILAGITKFSSGSQSKRDDKSMIQKQQEKELTKS